MSDLYGKAEVLEPHQQKLRQNFQRTAFKLKIAASTQGKCIVIEHTQLKTKWKIHKFFFCSLLLLKCLKFKFECITICFKNKFKISFYSTLHTSYFAECILKVMVSNAGGSNALIFQWRSAPLMLQGPKRLQAMLSKLLSVSKLSTLKQFKGQVTQ